MCSNSTVETCKHESVRVKLLLCCVLLCAGHVDQGSRHIMFEACEVRCTCEKMPGSDAVLLLPIFVAIRFPNVVSV